MALSFIGKPISLISHSDVRYRGILAGIDPQASTIQLSNVYSMGTESRRPPHQYIAPVQDPYAYIIFRASEVKDLSVDEVPTQQQHNVHDDPAVLGAGGPATKSYPAQPATQQPANGAPPSQGGFAQQPTQATLPTETQQQTASSQPAAGTTPARPQQQNGNNNNRRPNPVHTAAASLETVERALGDLRVSNNTPGQPNGGSARGGRRGGGQGNRGGRHGGAESELKVPKTDFDFASSNAKFDKATISPAVKSTSEDAVAEGAEGGQPAEDAPHPAYNPQRSFFDSLSSSSNAPAPNPSGGNPRGGRRGGGPGGAGGRNRREEEREKNVATFGEPGGVGLLGPGGYVGGWGGYGRRGGRRGGSRGGRGGGSGGNAPAVQARG